MRQLFAAAFAALVALGVAAAGWWALSTRTEEDPAEAVREAAEAYAAAWEDWDLPAMRELVRDPPESFEATHQELRGSLRPRTTQVTVGEVTLRDREADAPLTVTLTVDKVGELTWETTLLLQRGGGVWRLAWTPRSVHPSLREEFSWRVDTEPAERAPILAHDGTPLTAPGQVYVIGLEPRRVLEPDRFRSTFEEWLPEAVEDLDALLARGDLRPTWFYEITRLSPGRFEQVADRLTPLDGLIVREESGRLAFGEGFAQHVLGRVDEITAEMLEELGPTYEPGDRVGLFGLEEVFEGRLTGTPALQVVIVEPDGDVHETVHTAQADPPQAVHTTLDATVQQAVENALVGVAGRVGVVVVDGASGGIRAAASRPLDEYHRAFAGAYPPGSTFEVVTAATLLEAGRSADTPVECPVETVVGGVRIVNAGGADLGATSLREAFATGCDTSFALQTASLPAGSLAQMASRFGFDTAPSLPLDAAAPSFPTPADVAERAAAAVGQARVLASPLHMASVAAAVEAGLWRQPSLLLEEPGKVEHPIPAAVADQLPGLLRAGVTDGAAAGAAGAGMEVGGIVASATTPDGAPHAWFVGTFDGMGVAVLVEHGGAGGDVAAPVVARLLTELAALS